MGLFCFVSVDKIKTSHISYTTLGFTIHRCVPGTDTPYPYEAGNYIKLNLLDLDQAVLHKEVSFDKDKTKVITIWLLSEDYILDAIQRANAEWFDEVDAAVQGESLQKICLEFNAIMTTAVDGIKEGKMFKDNSFYGKVYGVTPETKTVEDLKHAYGWADPNGIDTQIFFTIGLTLPTAKTRGFTAYLIKKRVQSHDFSHMRVKMDTKSLALYIVVNYTSYCKHKEKTLHSRTYENSKI